MLAASGRFNIITARHVIHYNRLGLEYNHPQSREELQASFDRHGLISREPGGVALSPDTPEEYGFILDNLGVGLKITPRYKHVFEQVCEKIQRDYYNDLPLLLKNPWDFGQGWLIKQCWPDAKIIFLHRNPFHVLSSTLRMVSQTAQVRHPYLKMLSDGYAKLTESEFPWRVAQRIGLDNSDLLAKFIIHQTASQVKGYLKSIQTPSGQGRFDLCYETLCQKPTETIKATLDYLDISSSHTAYDQQIGTPRSSVLPAIACHRELVKRKFLRYTTAVGYDWSKLGEALSN